jgi:hypothetical protein
VHDCIYNVSSDYLSAVDTFLKAETKDLMNDIHKSIIYSIKDCIYLKGKGGVYTCSKCDGFGNAAPETIT